MFYGNGRYYVDTDTNVVQTLTEGGASWSSAGTLPLAQGHQFAVVLKDGRTLMAGGSQGSRTGNVPLTSTVIGSP